MSTTTSAVLRASNVSYALSCPSRICFALFTNQGSMFNLCIATPQSVIKELGGDDPLEDLGDLALGLVVALVLELVLGRIVERARGHVGAGRRVAERLHAPL